MPALENPQYEAFAHAYLALNYDGTAAARAIGSTDSAQNLMCYRGVAQRIRELQRPLLRRHDIVADRTMMGLARVGFADIRRLFDETGALRAINELDDDIAGAVRGVKVKEEFETDGYEIDLVTGQPDKSRPKRIRVVTTEVKLNDRVPALTVLAKHFKLVNDEGDGLNALANVLSDRLQSARRRRMPTVIDSTTNFREIEDARIVNRNVQAEPAEPGLSGEVQDAGHGPGAERAADAR